MSGSGSGAAHVPAEPGVDLSPENGAIDVPGAIAHFREHGWARLGRVASAATLDCLRARACDIMMGRVAHEGLFFQRDSETGRYEELVFGRGWEGPSLEYRKIEKLEADPYFRAWLENEVFERVATGLLGDAVALYRATLFTKSARGGTVLPWHQDGGSFWGLDRDPELQIGPPWTTRRKNRAASKCSTPVTSAASRLPSGGPSPETGCRSATRTRAPSPSPRARGRCSSFTTTSGTGPGGTRRDSRAAPSPFRTSAPPRGAPGAAARRARSCVYSAAPGVREER